MQFLGIDPGINGAVAVLEYANSAFPTEVAMHNTVSHLYKTPTLVLKEKKKERRVLDLPAMWQIAKNHGNATFAVIEQVHAVPKFGAASSFSFGVVYGAWQALLVANGIRFLPVSPLTWKRGMFDRMKTDKQASILKASQLFPAFTNTDFRKDHNAAEALLLAEYGRRIWLTGKAT